jgi:hypothetical protein
MYLGDGCISAERNIWRLRVALDTEYPGIIEACRQAIDVLMPTQRVSVFPQPTACVVAGPKNAARPSFAAEPRFLPTPS